MSAQKAREVTRAITGMPVSQALSVLDFTPKKAAFLIGKTLRYVAPGSGIPPQHPTFIGKSTCFTRNCA